MENAVISLEAVSSFLLKSVKFLLRTETCIWCLLVFDSRRDPERCFLFSSRP